MTRENVLETFNYQGYICLPDNVESEKRTICEELANEGVLIRKTGGWDYSTMYFLATQ